jgi:glycine cleavage system H protein
MKFPSNFHYTPEHLWTQLSADGDYLAGITDYAQDLLGDIVFIDAPKVGDLVSFGKPCGLIESVKTGSDLHAPISGVVTAINGDLVNAPEAINDKPYSAWIFKIKASDATQTQQLLDATGYQALINHR